MHEVQLASHKKSNGGTVAPAGRSKRELLCQRRAPQTDFWSTGVLQRLILVSPGMSPEAIPPILELKLFPNSTHMSPTSNAGREAHISPSILSQQALSQA